MVFPKRFPRVCKHVCLDARVLIKTLANGDESSLRKTNIYIYIYIYIYIHIVLQGFCRTSGFEDNSKEFPIGIAYRFPMEPCGFPMEPCGFPMDSL